MKTRLDRFHSYVSHPWLSRIYKKLTASELSFAQRFLEETCDLPKHDFSARLNHLFVDEVLKPKHWKELCELFSSANSGS